MKIVFFGSSKFAVPSLEKLLKKGYDICLVVTQPDKPKGRGRKMGECPLKQRAKDLGLNIYQPENLKDADVEKHLKDFKADLFVVVSYGKMIPDNILGLPVLDNINLHPSLLPLYRGPSPINTALKNGDEKTGVTVMRVEKEMDAGCVFKQQDVDIDLNDDYGVLHDRLADIGAGLIVEVVEKFQQCGKCYACEQDHDKATYTKKIEHEDCCIRWNQSAEEICTFVKSLSPEPCAHTSYKGECLKIYSCLAVEQNTDKKPGTIVEIVKKQGPVVSCGKGCVLITEIKPGNGKRMTAQAFMCGRGVDCLGQVLGL